MFMKATPVLTVIRGVGPKTIKKMMMKKTILISLLLALSILTFGRDETEELDGVVSYVTSQNVYVKFLSAKKINKGDNIFLKEDGKLIPVLTVEQRSSVSCVGKPIGVQQLKVGDKVVAVVPVDSKEEVVKANKEETPVQDQSIHKDTGTEPDDKTGQKIKGRLLAASYSNISNLSTADNYKLRYTFSLNVANIANSRLSFDNYISFTHRLNEWSVVQENVFNALKIYSLNLSYRVGENTSVWLGRKINPKVSSLGAIDGVQVETGSKNFYVGAVGGFRPDYSDYSFNFDLLEYGGYMGYTLRNKTGRMQTSLALFQQTNAGNIDRRFAYFQHDNTLIKKVSFFLSSELDLYRLQDGQPVTNLFLTSLYVSLHYRPISKLSVSCSYDNRKNVIYYETFKNYVDQLLQDAARQGLQMRVNYRPLKYMNVGLSGSYRVRKDDLRPTENVNGFVTYSQVPWIKTSATLSANLLQNSYLSGNIFGLRLTRDFLLGKIYGGLSYRYVNYLFENSQGKMNQHIGELDLAYRINRKFSVSIDYEGTFENQATYHRVYFNTILRF